MYLRMMLKQRMRVALITDYELNRDREANTINRLQFSIRKIENTMEVKSKSLGKANEQERILVNQRILEIRLANQ